MDSRRLTPLLFTVLAALALLYPKTAASRALGNDSASAAITPGTQAESPEGRPAKLDFPTAKDLVAQFLFASGGNQAASSSDSEEPAYDIKFLIATVPDPISSRLPRFFDSFIESLENAAQASGYTIDRFALPWFGKRNGPGDDIPLGALHSTSPTPA